MNRWPLLAVLTLSLAACNSQDAPKEGAADPANYDAVDGTWTMTPPLSAQSLTPDGINTLNYERALVATNAWGPIEVNRSNGERGIGDGKALTLNGKVYPKGYGVHAPSELKYSLAGTDSAKCVRFKAQIGLDDEVGNRGSAVFQVWGDGEKLFDSGVMTGASATKSVDVNLRGKATFRMVVTDAGNGKSYDHADWINPTLTCVPDISLNVPQATGIYQDTHGDVPVTFINRSRTFRGDLTYRLTSFIDEEDDTKTRYDLSSTGTRISGAGTFTRDVNVAVRRSSSPNGDEDHPFPDALVVSYQGEEVARAELRVYALEQRVVIEFPDQPYDLRAGETRIIQAHVRAIPGGETIGPRVDLVSEGNDIPDWWEVEGEGSVPKEGGTIPVRITATRAPRADEERTPEVRLEVSEYEFEHKGGSFSSVKLRFVP